MRGERLAASLGPAAQVWPRLDLGQLTDRLAAGAGVIGVDSGLSHIAVALDQPHVPSSRRRKGGAKVEGLSREELEKLTVELEEEMFVAAEELRFEYAAKLRDEIKDIRRELLGAGAPAATTHSPA